jgi:competence protein ComEC
MLFHNLLLTEIDTATVSLRIDAPLIARTGAIIGVAAYTLFVGPHIPTLRAGIMASCVILGFFLKRRAHVLDALSFAGIIVLIFWPHSIYSASFLLSFSAVLGIIATMEKGAELPGWFLLLIIPVVAAAFTMPIIIYLFGFISYAGIIVNIVVVPFFSIAIMPLGIFGLLVYPSPAHWLPSYSHWIAMR